METIEDNASYLSFVDYLIVLSLIGLGSYYWLFMRNKNKKSELDTSSIKTFSIESVIIRLFHN